MVPVRLDIPVKFEKIQSIDDRFTKVKIWLMHLGENLNGSYFSKEVVEEAIPTLANTPILGYIKENNDREIDFTNHRSELTRENGTWKWKYKCSAFGVIPESNNAKFEKRIGDDGVEREYLTVEGLMWNKWEEPIEIMNRDNTKSQSMELHSNYEGYFDKSGIFHFTKFKFFGATILGKDVQPAMVNASIELFSYNEILDQIKEKLAEYNSIVTNFDSTKEKGGNKVDKKQKPLEKYNVTKEQAVEVSSNVDELTIDELALNEKFSSNEDVAKENAPTENPLDETSETAETDSEPQAEDNTEFTESQEDVDTNFAISYEQKKNAIANSLMNDGGYDVVQYNGEFGSWEYKDYYYYYVDFTDDMVVALSRLDDWAYVGFNYTMNGDIPQIDFNSKKFLKITYEPIETGNAQVFNATKDIFELANNKANVEVSKSISDKFTELNNKLNEMSAKNSELENELEELRTYKKEKELEMRKLTINELLDKFSTLTDEEKESIRNAELESDKSIDDIETEIYALIGRKFANKFSKSQSNNKPIRFSVELDNFSNNGSSEKPYYYIIEKYSRKNK